MAPGYEGVMLDLKTLAQPTDEERLTAALRFGKRLRAARDAAELTVRELAKVSGLSVGYLCDVEHGRRWPSKEVAERLEQAFAKPRRQ